MSPATIKGLSFVSLLILSASAVGQNRNPNIKLTAREVSLGKSSAMRGLITSHDKKHAAWIVKRGNKECVALDGAVGDGYTEIEDDSLTFSDDGKHLAYVALRNGS